MKFELKITLPIYKILYSAVFMIIIVLVRPINSFSEIITRTKCCTACRGFYGGQLL